MISNETGVNFTNLDYSIIKKKNKTLTLVFLIIAISFFLVVIPFLVLMIIKIPIEINEVIRSYDEPEYQSFMVIFLGVFGSLTVFFLLLAYLFKIKQPVDYIIINKDNEFRKYYQVNYKKNQFLFFIENRAFYYNKITDQIRNINDYSEILALKNKYLFWLKWDDISDYKIINKNKKTILIFNYKNSRIVLNYRYYFPINNNSSPEKITEVISNKSTSTNSLQAYNTYYFTDNNHQLNIKHNNTVYNALNNNY